MSSPARPAALVFDLDGTLVDSRRDIAAGINRMRGDYGLAPFALERVVRMVGEGARVLVERAVAGELPPERIDEALGRYLAHYREVALDTTRPYPGIAAMLAALATIYPMAVLSNKGEEMTRHLLAALGLAPYFREVVGGDSLATRKPDPAGLALLAERLGVSLADLMLVGDSRVDAATAANAGSRFARVDWGFPRAAEEPEIPADLVAAHPADLAAALGRPGRT